MSTPPNQPAPVTPKPGDPHSTDPGVPPGMADEEPTGTPDSGRHQGESVPDKT